ncbi:MAG: DotA/TraY family protein [Alphaproteobacteria bacterium]|nr:DotA/TraY family protein [Alphaproteobacteria bacterium]MCL2505765.1 DotA/TraY family protein [Alphaproteobacteria bacterium]
MKGKKKNKNTEKTPAGSLFSWLFSVRLKSMWTPLFTDANMFIQIIAMTFASHKLIPKDYPGLTDPNVKISVRDVFRTAWSNLRFTKEGLPQVILFFAVILVIVVGFISVISLFLGLLTTAAHAQGLYPYGSIVSPPERDVAQQWLNFLFAMGNLPLIVSQDAVAPSWLVQSALHRALAFYSYAILVLAAFLLIYHLVSMTLQTAHLGESSGNSFKTIWGPIRFIIAIGILVPLPMIGGGGGSGLNAGQYILIKTATWGSGLASNAWQIFLDSMGSDRQLSIARVPYVLDIPTKLLFNYACAIDYNARVDKKLQAATTPKLKESKIQFGEGMLPAKTSTVTVQGKTGIKYSFSTTSGLGGEDTCGAIILLDPGEPLTQFDVFPDVAKAHNKVIMDMAGQFYDAGERILDLVSKEDAYKGRREQTEKEGLKAFPIEIVYDYQEAVTKALADKIRENLPIVDDITGELGKYGWVMAGAYIATIERAQANVSQGIQAAVPSIVSPKDTSNRLSLDLANKDAIGILKEVGGKMVQGFEHTAEYITGAPNRKDASSKSRAAVTEDLETFASWMRNGVLSANAASTPWAAQCAGTFGLSYGGTQGNQEDEGGGGWDPIGAALKWGVGVVTVTLDKVIDTFLWAVDTLAQFCGVWTATYAEDCTVGSTSPNVKTFELGINFTKNAAPFQQMTTFGHNNVNMGLRFLTMGVIAGVGGNFLDSLGIGGLLAPGIGTAGTLAATLFFIAATVFFLIGFIFAYILPLIPFTRFFFAVIIWIGEVIESVIAVPVIALAHLNPDGEGFIPDQAKKAYQFAFSIFLRPIMTVFGLIAGLLVFTIAAYFANFAYGHAVSASGGTAYEHEVLAKIVYTLLYTFLMFVCANKSFELITHLPDGAVSWMNASKSKTPDLGHIDNMQNYEKIVGGIMGVKAVQTVQGTTQTINQEVTKLVKKDKPDGDSIARIQPSLPNPGGGGNNP